MKNDQYVMVMISSPRDDSERIAKTIVEKKLAACAQVTSPITSFYYWKGTLNKDDEVLILLKTKKHLVEQIKRLISEIHPYEVPELIVFEIVSGLSAYFSWIDSVVDSQ